MAYTIKDPTAPITESQFNWLIQLASEVYATNPGARAEQLLLIAGLNKGQASVKIDELKALKAGIPAAPAAPPAYVPPFGHYLVDGQHVQVKKAKYGSAVNVIVNEQWIGALGFGKYAGKAAAAIETLHDEAAAYAAVIEFAKVTGKCGVCHTKLTDPKSIAAGIGPVCAKKYGK
jgi:mono/diheme cytochrome c family protein